MHELLLLKRAANSRVPSSDDDDADESGSKEGGSFGASSASASTTVVAMPPPEGFSPLHAQDPAALAFMERRRNLSRFSSKTNPSCEMCDLGCVLLICNYCTPFFSDRSTTFRFLYAILSLNFN